MLENAALVQVWCETQDDVTLVWANGSGEEVEFVQVKAHEFGQLWTIAKLLEKEKASVEGRVEKEEAEDEEDEEDVAETDPSSNGDGANCDSSQGANKKNSKKNPSHCILEKSLQYDRCNEPVRFRIVTARPVKDELKFLTYPIGSTLRDKTKSDYVTLLEAVKKKLGEFKSANGNDCTFWIDRTFWEWIHSLDAIQEKTFGK